MTVEDAMHFFECHSCDSSSFRNVDSGGLGLYPSWSIRYNFSGGEAQRVKLARELAKRDTGKTLYILG